MKKRQWILVLVVLAVVAGVVIWGRNRIHFDFAAFRAEVALADWRRIVLAVALIYISFLFRSVRWALLLRHNKKVPHFSLLGTQVMGFTAVALIGRVADPLRAYLVAKRTGLTLSTQIAVYIVERLFDAGSMALIFSLAMLSVPQADIEKVLLHSGLLAKLANNHPELSSLGARYSGLVLTLCGALFLIGVRIAGPAIASILEHAIGTISKRIGHAVAHKIRAFHSGLDTMRSFSDFAITASLSLAMWLLISLAYFEICGAYAGLSEPPFQKCVLLMIASGGASVIQLPVLGWFTQIGIVAAAIMGVLGASTEAATACATTLLAATFLSVIPLGLIWARFEHVSLTKLAAESEQAEEGLAS